MAIPFAFRAAGILIVAVFVSNPASAPQGAAPHSYLGFDRNDYPGDDAMKLLRRDFSFTGYWLSPPPEEKINTWSGKRKLLRSMGFGFVALYKGPDSGELKTEVAAKARGTREGGDAVAFAKKEGFAEGTVIFLDIEEGGRLPDTYHPYLAAWSEALSSAGFRAGAYCSGIPVKEGSHGTITTADDIRSHAATRDFTFWIFNDVCPPSPGCAFLHNPPLPSRGGISYASVWQFAQTPRRKERTARCATTYSRDGNCYAPGDSAHKWFLDVNSATSPDPSGDAK
jgi:Domain of unknown function (DUF1906)